MSIMQLLTLKDGQNGEVTELTGGREFKDRMSTLGIREKTRVRMIAKQPLGGPVVVKAGNTQITLGRGMASKIMVNV